VALTQQGQELLPYARQIVEMSEQMKNALHPDKELGGMVRLGVCQSVFDDCFEEIYRDFHARFPKVRVDVTVQGTENLLILLKKNQIDLACVIDRQLPRHEWKIKYSKEVRIGVVLNPNHSLAHKDMLTAEELKAEHFVLMEESAPYNQMLYPMFADYNMEEKIKLRLENCKMAARLVADCESLTLLPEFTVRDMAAEGKVRFIPLEGYIQQMQVQLIMHKTKVETPQLTGMSRVFCSLMEEQL
jgi:DNA-binding transcriptional LysR family regulator